MSEEIKQVTITIGINKQELDWLLSVQHSEFGKVGPKTDLEHAIDSLTCLQKTRGHFSLLDKTDKYGMYMAGTDVLLADMGNAPNSEIRARVISHLYNLLWATVNKEKLDAENA